MPTRVHAQNEFSHLILDASKALQGYVFMGLRIWGLAPHLLGAQVRYTHTEHHHDAHQNRDFVVIYLEIWDAPLIHAHCTTRIVIDVAYKRLCPDQSAILFDDDGFSTQHPESVTVTLPFFLLSYPVDRVMYGLEKIYRMSRHKLWLFRKIEKHLDPTTRQLLRQTFQNEWRLEQQRGPIPEATELL